MPLPREGSIIPDNQLGVKFNRQYIIGDYIVDFVCLESI